jgi:hypothetical protein
VLAPRDHPQRPFQLLLGDHFCLRHRPNPIVCLGNVSFERLGRATGIGAWGDTY